MATRTTPMTIGVSARTSMPKAIMPVYAKYAQPHRYGAEDRQRETDPLVDRVWGRPSTTALRLALANELIIPRFGM
jgi:hypothetical protein